MIEFFNEGSTVVWTLERLKCFMTSEIVDEDDSYEFGEALIVDDCNVSAQSVFPVVLIKMTLRSDATQHDYLYFIPETNSMGVWHGDLTYRVVTPHEIGRDFELLLPSGDRVRGKLTMRYGQLCLQFKKDYYAKAKKNHA